MIFIVIYTMITNYYFLKVTPMIHRLFVSMLLLCAAVLSAAPQPAPGDSTKKVGPVIIVIPVEGTVDPGMAAYLNRALKEASQYPDKVIILEMDTFGGQVDAALQMVDTMLNVKGAPTIAYVKTKAISAGALIALSCQQTLYATPHYHRGLCPLNIRQRWSQNAWRKVSVTTESKVPYTCKAQ